MEVRGSRMFKAEERFGNRLLHRVRLKLPFFCHVPFKNLLAGTEALTQLEFFGSFSKYLSLIVEE